MCSCTWYQYTLSKVHFHLRVVFWEMNEFSKEISRHLKLTGYKFNTIPNLLNALMSFLLTTYIKNEVFNLVIKMQSIHSKNCIPSQWLMNLYKYVWAAKELLTFIRSKIHFVIRQHLLWNQSRSLLNLCWWDTELLTMFYVSNVSI